MVRVGVRSSTVSFCSFFSWLISRVKKKKKKKKKKPDNHFLFFFLARCVLTPVVAKLYGQFRIKHVYLAFMVIFEIGLVVCAVAKSSHVFILGRALNGLGASGQFNGCMLILSCVCDARVRPLATALCMSMISVGSMTGPIIAGVVTARIGWRWCKLPLLRRLSSPSLPSSHHREIQVSGYFYPWAAPSSLLLPLPK